MSIVRVQNANGTGTNVSSFTITLSSTPTNGNTILVGVVSPAFNQTVTSITQTGATYTKDFQSNVNEDAEIWRATNVSSAGTTITVNVTGVVNAYVGFAVEYSGITNTSPLDQTASNTGNSSAPDSGTTATTTSASEVWIGILQQGFPTTVTFSSPTNGFSIVDQFYLSPSTAGGFLEKIVSTTGTANVSVTSNVSNFWEGIIVTYIATATTATTNQLMMTGLGT